MQMLDVPSGRTTLLEGAGLTFVNFLVLFFKETGAGHRASRFWYVAGSTALVCRCVVGVIQFLGIFLCLSDRLIVTSFLPPIRRKRKHG